VEGFLPNLSREGCNSSKRQKNEERGGSFENLQREFERGKEKCSCLHRCGAARRAVERAEKRKGAETMASVTIRGGN